MKIIKKHRVVGFDDARLELGEFTCSSWFNNEAHATKFEDCCMRRHWNERGGLVPDDDIIFPVEFSTGIETRLFLEIDECLLMTLTDLRKKFSRKFRSIETAKNFLDRNKMKRKALFIL